MAVCNHDCATHRAILNPLSPKKESQHHASQKQRRRRKERRKKENELGLFFLLGCPSLFFLLVFVLFSIGLLLV